MRCYALEGQLTNRLSQTVVEVPEVVRLVRGLFPR